MFDRALAAERAGIDRVTVSDHVVFGENLEAYGNPETGGMRGSEAADRPRRPVARADDRAVGGRRA